MDKLSSYKIAASGILVVCLAATALIVSSVNGGDEEKIEVAEVATSNVERHSVAEEVMADISRSKEDAAYRIEMRRRAREQEEANNNPYGRQFLKPPAVSAAPAGLTKSEKRDYEYRSSYVNGKRRALEESLRRQAKRQEAAGFPVDESYIQDELDHFDAKYGRWD